jgi:PAS domain S-box-containing protein
MGVSSQAIAFSKLTTRAAVVVGVGIGGMGILGWIIGVETLRTFFASDLAMKTNTAVGLMISALSLFFLYEFKNSPPAVILGRTLALFLLTLGALTISEHLFGVDFGIDQILFHEDPGAAGTVSPNRMGPPAAISFTLLGMSLLLLPSPKTWKCTFSQILACFAALIALMALIGYAYSVSPLYSVSEFTAIAAPTAIALGALCLGILAARPDCGLMSIMSSKGPGGVMARSLIVPAVVVPFLLGWVRMIAEENLLIENSTGRALMVLSTIVIFTALVWWNANALQTNATHRLRAEAERDTSVQQLMRSERRMRSIYDSVQEYLGLLTPKGIVLEANRASLSFANNKREDVVGLPFWDTVWFQFTPGAPAAVRDAVRRAAAGEQVRFETPLNLPTGEVKIFDISLEPIFDEIGNVALIVPEGRDITDRKQAEEAQRTLISIVESSQDAIVGKSLDGIITSWNLGAERLYGYSAEEIVGHSVVELLPPSHKNELPAILHRLAAGGHVEHYDALRVRKDGRHIDVSVTVSPVRNASGAIIGASAIARDITDRKRAEEALRKKEADLRSLNETLERRIADRTAVAEARARQLRALALDLANTESRERKRLAQLLHDHFQQLISAAKLKVGVIRLKVVGSKIVESLRQIESLLEEAIAASRSLATELSPPVLNDAGLTSALEWLARKMNADYGLNVLVSCDPEAEPRNDQIRTLLFECVRELLFNVVKHAKTNDAAIVSKISRDGRMIIVVSDKGMGFDPYSLAGDQRKTEASFGLFSIRERLSFFGGLLTIRSSPGTGTRMELSVPVEVTKLTTVAEPQEQAIAPAVEIAPVPDLKRRVRVLVADDHKLFRDGLIHVLSQEDGLVIVGEASDGQEAVDMARRLRPDILLVDVSMPKLNGVQVTAQVSRELPLTRIVGLSMHERDDMAKAMRAAGAVAYLTKGGPSEALLNVLRTITNSFSQPPKQLDLDPSNQ